MLLGSRDQRDQSKAHLPWLNPNKNLNYTGCERCEYDVSLSTVAMTDPGLRRFRTAARDLGTGAV